MKFSIGYNLDIKTLDLLERYQSYIEALYFPIPSVYLGSGRISPQPESYMHQIPLIIKKCRTLNIKSQILLNPLYEGRLGLNSLFFNKIIRYLKKLQDSGLSSVILVNPVYMRIIRKELPSIIIESSVNCFVRTVEHALYLKDLGVDIITIDRDINRNISLIKDIKNRTGLAIKIMLNEGCLSNCPYRIMHYNYLSVSHQGMGLSFPKKDIIRGVFDDKYCFEIYQRNPLKIFRIPFIPPEGIAHYTSFTDYYKLSTRAFSTNRMELCLKAYINRHYSGNLLTILDCPGLSFFEYIDYDTLKKNNFFKRMLTCSLECNNCLFCSPLFKKAVVLSRGLLQKVNRKEEKKAVRIYRKALLKCGYGEQRKTNYLMVGEAYFKLNRYSEAIKNIKLALKSKYKRQWTYLILGLCYESLHRYKEAINALKREIKMNPNSRDVITAIARCYNKVGDKKLFNRYMDRLIRVLKPQLTKKKNLKY
jgi:tetratricopeptide (TPR) repeat protein